jgi:hypothetical protein
MHQDNAPMPAKNAFSSPTWSLLILLAITACSPTYNWRETRVENTPLTAMLPCKPDHGSRSVILAGQAVTMTMLGCDAGGGTFAIAWTDLPPTQLPAGVAYGTVLVQWKQAMLQNMQATGSQDSAFQLKGSVAVTELTQVLAQGRRNDGQAVAAQAVWFVKGTQLFQAVVYAERLTPQMTEPYFGGLQLL